MSEKTLNIKGLQIRGDTSTNFASKNPVLKDRELVYETNTRKFKIGDGSTSYEDLEYLFSENVNWSSVSDTALSVPLNNPLAHTTIPNAYSVINKLGSYVSKSGDTISGALSFSTLEAIKRSVNNDSLRIFGGGTDSSSLILFGKDHTENSGIAILRARNSSSQADIWLYPNGTTNAPTPATNDNSGKIATTAFVKAQGYLTSSNSKEAYNEWGGKSLSGSVSPSDMGCIDEFGHNKLAFISPECITVEYSVDGGATWIDYAFTDEQKVAMVTTSSKKDVVIGGGTVSATDGTLTNENCANYLARVTISAWKNNKTNSVYTRAVKWLINYTSNGAKNGKVLVETRTIGNRLNNVDTWESIGTHLLSGWSGWNSINIPKISFGGSQSQTTQTAEFRFTLSIEGVNSNTAKASFIDFRLIGETNWAMPSEMARAGHLYTVDTNQNATFPRQVTAGQFNGNASSSTYSLRLNYSHGNEINFGGGRQGSVYFNYRNAMDDSISTKVDTTYYFCDYNGGGSNAYSSTVVAGNFQEGATCLVDKYASKTHTHYSINTEGDNRGTDTTPNDYSNTLVFKGLKSNNRINLQTDYTYSYLIGLRGWSDKSGGNSYELAFNNGGVYIRQGADTWGNWEKILTSASIITNDEIDEMFK